MWVGWNALASLHCSAYPTGPRVAVVQAGADRLFASWIFLMVAIIYGNKFFQFAEQQIWWVLFSATLVLAKRSFVSIGCDLIHA